MEYNLNNVAGPAPASQSSLQRYLREDLRNPREPGPFLLWGSVSACRMRQRKSHLGALSPRAIFGVSLLMCRPRPTMCGQAYSS